MDRPVRILLLCTANQCRSPMAEALLRRRLDERGVRADVVSAGLYPGGSAASPGAVAAMAAMGVDIGDHRSRRLSDDMVREADLLVGMARHHVREAVDLDPEAWSRSFSLKELVRRAGEVGPRSADEDLLRWLERVNGDRQRSDLLGPDGSFEDIVDPIGGPEPVYSATAEEIAGLVSRLVDLAFPGGAGSLPTTSSTTAES